MNTLTRQLEDFFDSEGWIINNPFGIQFCYHYDEDGILLTASGVILESGEPGASVTLELVSEHQDIEGFIRSYDLMFLSDLNTVTIDKLWTLYDSGSASILCDINDKKRVRFAKAGNAITATDADDEITNYSVSGKLSNAREYVDFVVAILP